MNEKPQEIWLQPWCEGCENALYRGDDGRMWCEYDEWQKCPDCDRPSVKYVLAPVNQ